MNFIQALLHNEKTVVWSLLSVIGISALCYVYCITTTIHNIVRAEEMQNATAEVALSLSEKEFDVIKLKNNVSLSYAETLGFVPVSKETYITKQSVGFVADNTHEI